MGVKTYFIPCYCVMMLGVVSMASACSCRPYLKDEACTSDYVIVAKVTEESELTETLFHYSLSVSNVLKSSEAYERAEQVMQTRDDGCGGSLTTGHEYIFAGDVVEYTDEGSPRNILEVQFCNYVDFAYLAYNDELKQEIEDLIENPPNCLRRRAFIQKLGAFNSPFTRSLNYHRRRWNHPFQKRKPAMKNMIKKRDSTANYLFKKSDTTANILSPFKKRDSTANNLIKKRDSSVNNLFKKRERTANVMFPFKKRETTANILFPFKKSDTTANILFPFKKSDTTANILFPFKKRETTANILFPFKKSEIIQEKGGTTMNRFFNKRQITN